MLQQLAPRNIGLADCDFYHSIELPVSGPQEGQWDLRGRFDDYVGGVELAGRSVLDVGTASGFLSFEAEKRGAIVTSFDVTSPALWRYVPVAGSTFVTDYASWRATADLWLERLRNSYWLAHEELGSSARYVTGNIYEIDGEQTFDVVMVGQVLVHLADGLSALAGAARACGDTLIVVEGNLENDAPVAALCAHKDAPYAWYHYSHGWYRQVLGLLGFASVQISTDSFRCNDATHDSQIELATVVARR